MCAHGMIWYGMKLYIYIYIYIYTTVCLGLNYVFDLKSFTPYHKSLKSKFQENPGFQSFEYDDIWKRIRG